jgi:hypothetical protein
VILAISMPHYMQPEEINQCQMSKLEVQMKPKTQSGKWMILAPFVKGPKALTLSHLSLI